MSMSSPGPCCALLVRICSVLYLYLYLYVVWFWVVRVSAGLVGFGFEGIENVLKCLALSPYSSSLLFNWVEREEEEGGSWGGTNPNPTKNSPNRLLPSPHTPVTSLSLSGHKRMSPSIRRRAQVGHGQAKIRPRARFDPIYANANCCCCGGREGNQDSLNKPNSALKKRAVHKISSCRP